MKFIVLVAVGLFPVRKDILLGEHTASSTACETGTVDCVVVRLGNRLPAQAKLKCYSSSTVETCDLAIRFPEDSARL